MPPSYRLCAAYTCAAVLRQQGLCAAHTGVHVHSTQPTQLVTHQARVEEP